jgi:hypothetical protein
MPKKRNKPFSCHGICHVVGGNCVYIQGPRDLLPILYALLCHFGSEGCRLKSCRTRHFDHNPRVDGASRCLSLRNRCPDESGGAGKQFRQPLQIGVNAKEEWFGSHSQESPIPIKKRLAEPGFLVSADSMA